MLLTSSAMSTSGLSSQLQDYLKKSNTDDSSSSLLQNSLSGKFGWFTAKNNSSHQQKEEEATVNGWFSEAQKDPLLPSLVSPKARTDNDRSRWIAPVFQFLWSDLKLYALERSNGNKNTI